MGMKLSENFGLDVRLKTTPTKFDLEYSSGVHQPVHACSRSREFQVA